MLDSDQERDQIPLRTVSTPVDRRRQNISVGRVQTEEHFRKLMWTNPLTFTDDVEVEEPPLRSSRDRVSRTTKKVLPNNAQEYQKMRTSQSLDQESSQDETEAQVGFLNPSNKKIGREYLSPIVSHPNKHSILLMK